MSCDSTSPEQVAEEVYRHLSINILPNESSTYNNANSIPQIRDGAMRYRWTDTNQQTYRLERLNNVRTRRPVVLYKVLYLRCDLTTKTLTLSCILYQTVCGSRILLVLPCPLTWFFYTRRFAVLEVTCIDSFLLLRKTHDLNYLLSRFLLYKPTI